MFYYVNQKNLFEKALAAIDSWNNISYDEMFTTKEMEAKAEMDSYYDQIESLGLMDEFMDYAGI